MAVNDVHLTTLSSCTPRVTPGPLLASYGVSHQQNVFDPYSPLSHSTSSLPGSTNGHLSLEPSLLSTSVPSMPNRTDISLPIDAMPNRTDISLPIDAIPNLTDISLLIDAMPNRTDISFPIDTMSNTGAAYPSNSALADNFIMSTPTANMASAGLATAGMATENMATTGMTSTMDSFPAQYSRYVRRNFGKAFLRQVVLEEVLFGAITQTNARVICSKLCLSVKIIC